jgi:hypothetical protein
MSLGDENGQWNAPSGGSHPPAGEIHAETRELCLQLPDPIVFEDTVCSLLLDPCGWVEPNPDPPRQQVPA